MTKEQIQSYFERYPQSDECFEAAGKLFHTQGAAMNFSEKPIKHIRNAQEGKATDSNNDDVNFIDIDLSTLDQAVLKKYADKFGLKAENNKKATLLATLLEKQLELKQSENDEGGDK
ncbi:MAG: hypothetical protein LBT27_05515 [Prevotellaceae bacterium]|jgi:elongation factor P--beta-lysine ligase|nr:hypothetical protein [Prevotellaceae bacterium]